MQIVKCCSLQTEVLEETKTIDLKSIADEALTKCPSVETCIVLKRINSSIKLNKIDKWWHEELNGESDKFDSIEIDLRTHYLFFIHPDLQENQKEWCIHAEVIWFTHHILSKAYFSTNIMIYTGAQLI